MFDLFLLWEMWPIINCSLCSIKQENEHDDNIYNAVTIKPKWVLRYSNIMLTVYMWGDPKSRKMHQLFEV